jgi:hypothetical protein
MKPVLMIHEVKETLFDLPLEDYILTFDDALYSQYYYWPNIKNINTDKYFFVSSNIYCKEGQQNLDFPTCEQAHAKARTGNFEDYMTIEQLKELALDPSVTIGGHGHDHIDLSEIHGLQKKIDVIISDTESMMYWFKLNLGYYPHAFCFPYNNDVDKVYTSILKKRGFTELFGGGRNNPVTLRR